MRLFIYDGIKVNPCYLAYVSRMMIMMIMMIMIMMILEKYYDMTVWILAWNYISFTIAAGLIRLHMPGVKKSRV